VRRIASAFALCLLVGAPSARAQDGLPPVDAAPVAAAELSSGLSVFVNEFRVRGNTVLTPEEVARALAPWVGRSVDSEELLRARDALTQLYVERGYLGTGAMLPDQVVRDGIVELQVVEGKLGDIEVRGARGLDSTWLRERLRFSDGEPFRISALEERLQRLQRDPLIRRIDARLSPGVAPGESALALEIEEQQPWLLSGQVANDVSSAFGGRSARLGIAHLNLTGRGDSLAADFASAEGLTDLELAYVRPLTRWDTRLELRGRRSLGEVVTGDFEDAVDSERTSYAAALVQPLLDTAYDELEVGVATEFRKGEVELFGEPISLYSAEDDSESRLGLLRLFQAWTHRSLEEVLALRLTATFGLDWFDASVGSRSAPFTGAPGSADPDARFFAWLAQLRYARHLPGSLGLQLVARADVQVADDALLPLERFSVGGSDTVRGYPEHQLVRDNAVVASLELRVPILRDPLDRPVLELAPFFDFGKGWNRERDESPQSIASAGLGLRWSPHPRLGFEAYWGAKLRDVDEGDPEGLQDLGIHVRMRLTSF
jgi:hemolysin activation/secretion protein